MLVFSWDFVALLRFDKLRQLAYWDAFFGLLARFIRSATDSVSLAKKLELILSTHGCKLYSARLGPWPLHAAKANTLWHCPAVASKEWQFKKIEIFEEIKYNRYMAGCYVKSIVKSFIANNPRLLRNRVAPLFLQKGLDFVVEYIRSVRNWKEHLPTVAALSGAYRRRSKRDETVIPHSFTFVQRCRAPIQFDSICFENFCLFTTSTSPQLWILLNLLPSFANQSVIHAPTLALRNAKHTSAASCGTYASEIQTIWEWHLLPGKRVCFWFGPISATTFSSSWWLCSITCGASNQKFSPRSMPKILVLISGGFELKESCFQLQLL